MLFMDELVLSLPPFSRRLEISLYSFSYIFQALRSNQPPGKGQWSRINLSFSSFFAIFLL